jgi:hypothetical protein
VKYTETAQYKSCSLPLCLPSGTPSTFYEHQQSTVRISVFQILYFEFQINFLDREKSFSLCHNAFHWVKHRTGAQKMLVMDTSLCASTEWFKTGVCSGPGSVQDAGDRKMRHSQHLLKGLGL